MTNQNDRRDASEAPFTDEHFLRSRRQSFILRVWDDSSGAMRGYLWDVRTQTRYPVKDLSDLPALVRSLVCHQPPSEDNER